MTQPWDAPARRRPWPAVLGGEIPVVLALLAAGLLLGGVWALAAPRTARAADPGESRIAVDGLLALLQLGAGLVTAAGLAVVPGRDRAVRLVTVLVGSAVGGLLAVPLGAARGLHLHAPGSALLWPLVVAVLTTLRMLAGPGVLPGRRRGAAGARRLTPRPASEIARERKLSG